jgi:hypothetical protein
MLKEAYLFRKASDSLIESSLGDVRSLPLAMPLKEMTTDCEFLRVNVLIFWEDIQLPSLGQPVE